MNDIYCEYIPSTDTYNYINEKTHEFVVLEFNKSPIYYLINGDKYYSESELKRQGLKAKHITQLGDPDFLAPNRRFPGKSDMKLHLVEKVDKLFPY